MIECVLEVFPLERFITDGKLSLIIEFWTQLNPIFTHIFRPFLPFNLSVSTKYITN